MQEFWWKRLSKSSKIPWMSWDRMTSAKSSGGLGFRDLVLFNQALLAKDGDLFSTIPPLLLIFLSINITFLLFWILPWALGFLLFGGVFSKLRDYYI